MGLGAACDRDGFSFGKVPENSTPIWHPGLDKSERVPFKKARQTDAAALRLRGGHAIRNANPFLAARRRRRMASRRFPQCKSQPPSSKATQG